MDNSNIVPKSERRSLPILTKYEKVRLLGDRAKQISDGSKRMIKPENITSAMDIAIAELKNRVIPMKIIRPMPDGRVEIWDVNELEF